jgi:hypothetical protein
MGIRFVDRLYLLGFCFSVPLSSDNYPLLVCGMVESFSWPGYFVILLVYG